MQLIHADSYYHRLAEDFATAQHSITVAAMIVAVGPLTARLFDELDLATERGVKVRILVDMYYTRLFCLFDDGSVTRASRKRWRRTKARLERLQKAGAQIVVTGGTGRQRRNPYKRCCHVKWTVIDGAVYTFGGVNFMDRSFGHADYMLLSHNQRLLKYIAAYSEQLPGADEAQQLDEHNRLLFDSGQVGQSIIYQRACELAQQAKHVYYVSQFQPTGPLAIAMSTVGYTCYFNKSKQLSFPANAAAVWDSKRHKVHNLYVRSRYIHAKFMLFVLKDGRRVALSGSHNFSYRGVAYGTQEIAVESTDPDVWQKLYDFLTNEIA